jgi:polyhydroxyalkanoate synthesis repressor PhaR
MNTSKEKIIIKKYENRRLYSSSEKKYVTLQNIEKYITKGRSVQVLENESNQDITSSLLTQILLERGGFKDFPVEVLEQLIRLNDATVNTLWGQFMGQSFKVFMHMQSEVTSSYKKFFAAFAAKK